MDQLDAWNQVPHQSVTGFNFCPPHCLVMHVLQSSSFLLLPCHSPLLFSSLGNLHTFTRWRYSYTITTRLIASSSLFLCPTHSSSSAGSVCLGYHHLSSSSLFTPPPPLPPPSPPPIPSLQPQCHHPLDLHVVDTKISLPHSSLPPPSPPPPFTAAAVPPPTAGGGPGVHHLSRVQPGGHRPPTSSPAHRRGPHLSR